MRYYRAGPWICSIRRGEGRLAGVSPLGGACVPLSSRLDRRRRVAHDADGTEEPGSTTTAEGDTTMAGKVRLNKVIELLEQGQAVFSCGTVPNGNFEEIAAL